MSKEAMELALELFEQFGRDSRLKYEHQAIYKTIVALKEALAKQEPVQVSPLDFVEMVMEKEHLVGRPIFWAQWPNEEQK